MDSLDETIETLKQGKYPPLESIKMICDKAIEILSPLPNIVHVPAPITVVGDLHGQFYDLLDLLSIGGQVPDTNYLFLGDYVDRGYYSIETFFLLLALKVRYPTRVTMLRGNHESRQTTIAYGFYDEVLRKYGSADVWDMIVKVFDVLPICAVIDQRIFCVHGGLSPLVGSVESVNKLDRKKEIPERGVLCDLLWSDPDNVSGYVLSPRGAGYLYGETAVNNFERENKFSLILRAHQLAVEGYCEWFDRKLFTVWSSPNYCYRGGNPASFLEVDQDLNTTWRMFEAAPTSARANVPPITSIEYFM